MSRIVILSLAFLSLSPYGALFAQTTEEIPTPGPQHERLYWFLGEWRGEETFSDSFWSPGGDKGTGTYRYSRTLGGMFVELAYSTELASAGHFEGRGFLGYHPAERRYQYSWFDPMGVAAVAHGDWDGDTLEFETDSTTMEDGEPYRLQVMYRIVGPHEFAFEMNAIRGDAAPQPLMSATYRRVGVSEPLAETNGGGVAPCCRESQELLAQGKPILECCKKAQEARESGGEVPPCCGGR